MQPIRKFKNVSYSKWKDPSLSVLNPSAPAPSLPSGHGSDSFVFQFVVPNESQQPFKYSRRIVPKSSDELEPEEHPVSEEVPETEADADETKPDNSTETAEDEPRNDEDSKDLNLEVEVSSDAPQHSSEDQPEPDLSEAKEAENSESPVDSEDKETASENHHSEESDSHPGSANDSSDISIDPATEDLEPVAEPIASEMSPNASIEDSATEVAETPVQDEAGSAKDILVESKIVEAAESESIPNDVAGEKGNTVSMTEDTGTESSGGASSPRKIAFAPEVDESKPHRPKKKPKKSSDHSKPPKPKTKREARLKEIMANQEQHHEEHEAKQGDALPSKAEEPVVQAEENVEPETLTDGTSPDGPAENDVADDNADDGKGSNAASEENSGGPEDSVESIPADSEESISIPNDSESPNAVENQSLQTTQSPESEKDTPFETSPPGETTDSGPAAEEAKSDEETVKPIPAEQNQQIEEHISNEPEEPPPKEEVTEAAESNVNEATEEIVNEEELHEPSDGITNENNGEVDPPLDESVSGEAVSGDSDPPENPILTSTESNEESAAAEEISDQTKETEIAVDESAAPTSENLPCEEDSKNETVLGSAKEEEKIEQDITAELIMDDTAATQEEKEESVEENTNLVEAKLEEEEVPDSRDVLPSTEQTLVEGITKNDIHEESPPSPNHSKRSPSSGKERNRPDHWVRPAARSRKAKHKDDEHMELKETTKHDHHDKHEFAGLAVIGADAVTNRGLVKHHRTHEQDEEDRTLEWARQVRRTAMQAAEQEKRKARKESKRAAQVRLELKLAQEANEKRELQMRRRKDRREEIDRLVAGSRDFPEPEAGQPHRRRSSFNGIPTNEQRKKETSRDDDEPGHHHHHHHHRHHHRHHHHRERSKGTEDHPTGTAHSPTKVSSRKADRIPTDKRVSSSPKSSRRRSDEEDKKPRRRNSTTEEPIKMLWDGVRKAFHFP